MVTYFEKLQEEIDRDVRELNNLNLEKRALYVSRRSWSDDNYDREETAINTKIEEIIRRINEKKDLLATYTLVNNYTTDVKALADMYNEETDIKFKDEISNQILTKRDFINNKLDSLPQELSKELREMYLRTTETIEDNKILSLEKEKQALIEKLDNAKEKVSTSIKNIQDIFSEEKFIIENNGPFKTEKELDEFYEKYMNKKVQENEQLKLLRKQEEKIIKSVKILDKRIKDRREIVELSRKININPDDYENIINRIKNRDEVTKLYKSLGLNNVLDLRNKALYPTEEELNNYREQIKNRLVEEKINQIKRSNTKALPQYKEIKEVTGSKVKNEQEEVMPKLVENLVNEIIEESNNKREIPVRREINEDVAPYGYKTIISNLVRGLQPNKKDGKRYRASNIDVRQSFKDELHTGNYLYNVVHVVPAIIKLPIQLIRKLSSKLTYTKEAKNRMKTIKARLDDLSDRDLMILLKEYSNHAASEKYGTGLNILISERINKFVDEKIDSINKNIEEKYKEIFYCVKELDAANSIMSFKNTTQQRKEKLKKYTDSLIKGKAELVASVRKDYEDAKTLLSSGLHGFNENMRATESKMSYIGRRFSKDHDLDVELLEKEAKIERAERQAIREGNDEMALRCFVAAESLLSKNTKVERSIFGNRSTGKKYYSPLAEKLDYSNDPFVRDIFTTVAVVGASLTAINTLTNKNNINAQIEEINTHNKDIMDEVNKSGETLVNNKDAISEGMKAQSYQDSLNISNALERKALDQSSEVHGGWSVGTKSYYDARSVAQGTYVDFYNSTKNTIQDIASKYSTGTITQTEAINMLNEVTKSSQNTLSNVVKEAMPTLSIYARDHAQFDLSGVQETMNYIVSNPNAITNMNQAMLESINVGENLQNLTLEQIDLLNTIPSNVSNQLLTAASAAALAMNVNQTINTNNKKGKYGNTITNIVDNYVKQQEEQSKKTR